jgi:hypothetical protein
MVIVTGGQKDAAAIEIAFAATNLSTVFYGSEPQSVI